MPGMNLRDSPALAYTVGVVAATLIIIFLTKLYAQRKQFLKMKKQGLVRNPSFYIESPRSSKLTLIAKSQCLPIILFLAISLSSPASCRSFRVIATTSIFLDFFERLILNLALISTWILGPSVHQCFSSLSPMRFNRSLRTIPCPSIRTCASFYVRLRMAVTL